MMENKLQKLDCIFSNSDVHPRIKSLEFLAGKALLKYARKNLPNAMTRINEEWYAMKAKNNNLRDPNPLLTVHNHAEPATEEFTETIIKHFKIPTKPWFKDALIRNFIFSDERIKCVLLILISSY